MYYFYYYFYYVFFSFVLHWLCPTFNIIAEYVPTEIGNVYVYAIFSADGYGKFHNLPCDLPCTAVVFGGGLTQKIMRIF